MSDLKDKLAKAWANDLGERLPAGHAVYPQRRPQNVKPPFSVVTVMRMEQQTPGSDVWLADVKMVCVCDMAEGGSTEQETRIRRRLVKYYDDLLRGPYDDRAAHQTTLRLRDQHKAGPSKG